MKIANAFVQRASEQYPWFTDYGSDDKGGVRLGWS